MKRIIIAVVNTSTVMSICMIIGLTSFIGVIAALLVVALPITLLVRV